VAKLFISIVLHKGVAGYMLTVKETFP